MKPAALFLTLIPAYASAETLTATRMIRPATVIAASDLTVTDVAVPGALGADTDIVGLEARVMLYPGRPIRAGDVGPAALVERNEPVQLIYRQGRLTILAEGRALSRGAAGETVRVMNLASRITVSGQVEMNGSVLVHGR